MWRELVAVELWGGGGGGGDWLLVSSMGEGGGWLLVSSMGEGGLIVGEQYGGGGADCW